MVQSVAEARRRHPPSGIDFFEVGAPVRELPRRSADEIENGEARYGLRGAREGAGLQIRCHDI
jgi:hypothetical protein